MIAAGGRYRRVSVRASVLGAVVVFVCLLSGGSVWARPSVEPFGIVPGSFGVVPSTLQAGAHADLTFSFDFFHEALGHTSNDARTLLIKLPRGFVGNNTAVPACTDAQLIAGGTYLPNCPVASQVGQVSFEVANTLHVGGPPAHFTVPLYNMQVTSFGVTAEFGYKTVLFTQVLQVGVNPEDSSLLTTVPDLPKAEPFNILTTVWGLPASHVHDAQRGQTCGEDYEVPALCIYPKGGAEEARIPVEPFLSNATSCESHVAELKVDSWEQPEAFSEAVFEMPALTECDRVPFNPSVEIAPTTRSAESSSGLDVSLVVPQSWENPYSLATAHLKDSTVALPVGYTANPSLASGLGVCTPAQFASETSFSAPGAGCPLESKIGTVDVETPVLAEKHLTGNIYIAKPYENKPEFGTPEHPGGSLLALYIVVKDPQRGIIVKLAGKIEPDPVTGQLVTSFDNNPQVPFSRFTLELRQGATSPLVSPPACGSYIAEADLTPWSAPLSPRHVASPPFQIETGIGGGPCPAGGVPPFHPQAIAGTQHNAAGSYSPFYLRLERRDGEQELTGFSTVMPPGLTGNLTGIPFCPDAAIEAARGRSGQEELEAPSCPAASKVGHTIVEVGVGTVLAQTPGSLYLAGPYHGAPLSLVSITSATVGPFDLGTVVIRFALRINPVTAQVEVSPTGSEPIPHIIKGIVTHVRNIHVYVDRPDFIINPTSCEHLQVQNAVSGGGADPSNPADQSSMSVASPFQAADCANLAFKPAFTVSTSAKTSRADGASLTAKLAVPGALGTQANISRVKVELPKQLPSRLPTLQKACTAAQFEANPAGCPPASIIGHAKAITPILPVPLEGPAYFVSHGGEGWPSLEIVLQGYGFTIDLVGTTFISKQGVTSSTFKTVPDQPVTSFELTLPERPYSALTALGNLCTAKNLTMPTELVGQNGAEIKQNTKVAVIGCPKARHVKHKRKTHASRKRKRAKTGKRK